MGKRPRTGNGEKKIHNNNNIEELWSSRIEWLMNFISKPFHTAKLRQARVQNLHICRLSVLTGHPLCGAV